MELTKEDAIKNHREMWNWIANKIKNEHDVPTELEYLEENNINSEDIFSHCFCCEYSINKLHQMENTYFGQYCKYCPLDWGSEAESTQCANMYVPDDYLGLYSTFLNFDPIYDDYENVYKIAKEIAELPERMNDDK